ncbi:SPOR domain-containing protein, partial [Brevundimonas naejangsanensis]
SLPTEVTPPPSARRTENRPPESLTAALNGGSAATPTPPARTTRNPPARAAAPAPAPADRWTVQVGAFREEAVARDWLNNVSRRFSSQFSNAQRDVQTANGWYRSRFTGMTQQAAEAACEALSERRVTCMVVRPS